MHLIKKQDYFKRYFELYSPLSTHKEAYLKLEAEYYRKYGVYRYTSYSSFRNAKSDYIRR